MATISAPKQELDEGILIEDHELLIDTHREEPSSANSIGGYADDEKSLEESDDEEGIEIVVEKGGFDKVIKASKSPKSKASYFSRASELVVKSFTLRQQQEEEEYSPSTPPYKLSLASATFDTAELSLSPSEQDRSLSGGDGYSTVSAGSSDCYSGAAANIVRTPSSRKEFFSRLSPTRVATILEEQQQQQEEQKRVEIQKEQDEIDRGLLEQLPVDDSTVGTIDNRSIERSSIDGSLRNLPLEIQSTGEGSSTNRIELDLEHAEMVQEMVSEINRDEGDVLAKRDKKATSIVAVESPPDGIPKSPEEETKPVPSSSLTQPKPPKRMSPLAAQLALEKAASKPGPEKEKAPSPSPKDGMIAPTNESTKNTKKSPTKGRLSSLAALVALERMTKKRSPEKKKSSKVRSSRAGKSSLTAQIELETAKTEEPVEKMESPRSLSPPSGESLPAAQIEIEETQKECIEKEIEQTTQKECIEEEKTEPSKDVSTPPLEKPGRDEENEIVLKAPPPSPVRKPMKATDLSKDPDELPFAPSMGRLSTSQLLLLDNHPEERAAGPIDLDEVYDHIEQEKVESIETPNVTAPSLASSRSLSMASGERQCQVDPARAKHTTLAAMLLIVIGIGTLGNLFDHSWNFSSKQTQPAKILPESMPPKQKEYPKQQVIVKSFPKFKFTSNEEEMSTFHEVTGSAPKKVSPKQQVVGEESPKQHRKAKKSRRKQVDLDERFSILWDSIVF